MNKPLTPADISALPVDERLRLLEVIWDSLDLEAIDARLPDWQKDEIERRLDALDAGTSKGTPWPGVRRRS